MDVGSSTIHFFFIYTFSYVLFLGPRDGLHFRSCDRTWLPVRRTEGSRTPHHAGTGVGKQVLLLVLYISQSITPQAPLKKPVYGGTRGDLFHPCCLILRSLTLVAFCALPLPLDCFFPQWLVWLGLRCSLVWSVCVQGHLSCRCCYRAIVVCGILPLPPCQLHPELTFTTLSSFLLWDLGLLSISLWRLHISCICITYHRCRVFYCLSSRGVGTLVYVPSYMLLYFNCF